MGISFLTALVCWERRRYWIGSAISRLDDAMIETSVKFTSKIASTSQRIFVHDFHGATARVPVGATAFTLRTNHFVAVCVDTSDPGEAREATSQRAWIEEAAGHLAAVTLPGGYVNFLSAEDAERTRLFYGSEADRLREVKTRVDPMNVFRGEGMKQVSERSFCRRQASRPGL